MASRRREWVRRMQAVVDLFYNKSTTKIPVGLYRKTFIKRRVPNNRRVSNKRRGFEAYVLTNAGSRLSAVVAALKI